MNKSNNFRLEVIGKIAKDKTRTLGKTSQKWVVLNFDNNLAQSLFFAFAVKWETTPSFFQPPLPAISPNP